MTAISPAARSDPESRFDMFRMIALVRLKDGADAEAAVSACREMVSTDDNILNGEVVAGLMLLDSEAAPHASYSLVLDFVDKAAWERYLVGEPHAKFHGHIFASVTSMMATQYERDAE
jgi:hypothetical protein